MGGISMKLNLERVRDLPTMAEKRTAIFKAIQQATRIPALLVDLLGERSSIKASMAGTPSRFAANDPRIELPTVADIKAYLTSDKAGRILGAKWAVPADNPNLTGVASRLQQFFHENMPEMDLGWQSFFDFVDMRTANEDHIDLIGTNLGITFQQINSAGRIKPTRAINENKVTLGYVTYGAGLSILDDWLRFNKFYAVQDAIDEFFAQYYQTQATLHYGLFSALSSGVNVAFATDAATTFNTAASALLRGLQNAGLGVTSNQRLDILCAPEKVGVILAMLDAQRGSPMIAFGTQKQPIAFTVGNVISSVNIAAADTGYYLVLSGKKNKRVVWDDLHIESDRDPSVGATDWFGRGKFNAAIGNSAQVKRVLYS